MEAKQATGPKSQFHEEANMPQLTPNELLVMASQMVRYDSETGLFHWTVKPAKWIEVGAPAGTKKTSGYIEIGVKKRAVQAHRLAWYMHYGASPLQLIDHINGDRADNRIVNLRDVDRSVNAQNVRRAPISNISTGLLGVTYLKRERKYRAKIVLNKRPISLGEFDSAEAAHKRYLEAKRMLHIGCSI